MVTPSPLKNRGRKMILLQRTVKTAVAAALLATTGLAGAVNLVSNFSFEQPALSGGTPTFGNFRSLPLGNTDMPNWGVISDSIAWINGPISAGLGLLTAQQGSYFLDLTDTQLSSPFGGVSQLLPTVSGSPYELKFWLGTSAFYNPQTGASSLVSIAGNNITVSSTITTMPNSWEEKTITFTALGASTLLAFTGIAGQDYIGLDNISITLVPEPGTLAMLFAGLAAIGTVVSRRRNQIG
jgi:hypothetical protein